MWNHRVVKTVYNSPDKSLPPYIYYGIKEVYYDDEGRVFQSTVEAMRVSGDSVEDLKQTLLWMWAALKAPVLDEENIPEEGAKDILGEAEEELDNLVEEKK